MKIPHAAYLVAMMWLIQMVQSLFWGDMGRYGILPRDFHGLIGILFAPWIHHGWWHLIGNSIPFLVLGTLIQFKNTVIFWEATLLITLIAGAGTWMLGSPAYHAGASGLVLGYWSFLIANAWFQRSIKAILIASISLILYGGFIFILFDVRPHISWAGHASGIVAGIIVAKLYVNSCKSELLAADSQDIE